MTESDKFAGSDSKSSKDLSRSNKLSSDSRDMISSLVCKQMVSMELWIRWYSEKSIEGSDLNNSAIFSPPCCDLK